VVATVPGILVAPQGFYREEAFDERANAMITSSG
jgi:hypothetical protein